MKIFLSTILLLTLLTPSLSLAQKTEAPADTVNTPTEGIGQSERKDITTATTKHLYSNVRGYIRTVGSVKITLWKLKKSS